MIKPAPWKSVCKKCGWSKICAPSSDVVSAGCGIFLECPICGNKDLRSETLNAFELVVVRLKR